MSDALPIIVMSNTLTDAQRIFSLQEKIFSRIDSQTERSEIAKTIIAASDAFLALEDDPQNKKKAYCVLKGKVPGGWVSFISQDYKYVA